MKLDGTTSGPKSFKGPVGIELSRDDLDEKEFVEFVQIESDLSVPEAVFNDLSSDQRVLLAYIQYIATKNFHPCLMWKLGKLNHSRWLTLAIRILSLYCKTLNPTVKLIKLVKYIIFVYGPTWFCIKKNSHWQDGPRNLYFLLDKLRSTQPADVILTCAPAVQRNAFFAFCDNILAAMLSDNRFEIRNLGVERIISIRNSDNIEPDRSLPDLNWDSKSYTEIVDFDSLKRDQMIEPAVTRHISDEELRDAIAGGPMVLEGFSNHTQAVERAIKQGKT